MHKAMLWDSGESGSVICNLCSHRCSIKPGRFGICRTRQNIDGTLFSLVYDRVAALHVDPIEKKPLFHFYPGSRSLSIATMGCNFHCDNCQNYQISQIEKNNPVQGDSLSPFELVDIAFREKCGSISYTYTEPTVYFELAYDTAEIASGRGIKNVFVSNGYMTGEALRRISPYLDAINIDLKFFNDDLYRKVCGAQLEPVLSSIRLCRELDIWVEVTTLIIPGLNDDTEQLAAIADFIVSVDPDMPWHISRFYPTWHMTDRHGTPVNTLRHAHETGKDRGLRYVYEGNIPGQGGEDTVCPGCGKVLVQRSGFTVLKNDINLGKCSGCGASIAGLWND